MTDSYNWDDEYKEAVRYDLMAQGKAKKFISPMELAEGKEIVFCPTCDARLGGVEDKKFKHKLETLKFSESMNIECGNCKTVVATVKGFHALENAYIRTNRNSWEDKDAG